MEGDEVYVCDVSYIAEVCNCRINRICRECLIRFNKMLDEESE